MTTPANDNTRDLLLGARAIGDFLGTTKQQTYRLIYDDVLPAFKVGGAIAARRSTLTKWLEEQEAAGRKAA